MPSQSADQLVAKRCEPCRGDIPKYTRAQAEEQLQNLNGWQLGEDGTRIRKNWTMKDFISGIDFFNEIAKLSEAEDHHPDLHLTGYRNASVELSTHAIAGLSENDFILAAKIDRLPVKTKS